MPALSVVRGTRRTRNSPRAASKATASPRAWPNLLGRQVEALGRALPSPARKTIARATESALKVALRFALRTIDKKSPAKAAKGLHKAAAAASGAVGGAFGLASTAIELPISTDDPVALDRRNRARGRRGSLASRRRRSPASKSSRSAARRPAKRRSRAVISPCAARSPSRSAKAPGSSRSAVWRTRRRRYSSGFVSQIAARFGVVVSEKLAAQAVPVARCDRRRGGQRRLRRAFPDPRARPFHRAPT